MSIHEHLTSFGNFQVVDWQPGVALKNLDTTIYRLALEYDDERTWPDIFSAYLSDPSAGQTRGIVVGVFAGEMVDLPPTDAVEALIAARDRLPQLTCIFLNDITPEENEISWIHNTDNAPLLHAYPALRHYGVRGGNDLRFKNLQAPALEHLVVQTGGLNGDALRDLMQARLPQLQHLELYLGTDEYGASYDLDDLAPLLQANAFPRVTSLGLKDAEDEDDVIRAVLASPLLPQWQTLDFSLGILTDAGGQALLAAAPKLAHLKHLNLSHHFLSDDMVGKLQAMASAGGVTIDLSEQQDDDDDYRFVSIGE